MALTNPWLADAMPTQKLDPERLEDRILNLLSAHNMCVPLVGLAGSRGAQIFGEAVSIRSDDPRFAEHWEAFRWESEQIEQGRSPDDDPGALVVVEAKRIVYTEHWLRREGFAARQFWKRD